MRRVTIAAIQPPEPRMDLGISPDLMIERGMQRLDEAGARHADIAVLPEYFNAFGLSRGPALEAADDVPHLRDRVANVAKRHAMFVVLPLIVRHGRRHFNRAILLDRAGREVGHYDKIHPTVSEKRNYGVTAGSAIPTFETDFGTIGIMTCYDVYFPELSRILGLKGAEIIFFPTLQRSEREEVCDMQVRLRAMDSFAYVVRSSYGSPTMPARSCIVRPDGDIIADAGHTEGFAIATIDLDDRWRRPRCHGEPPAAVRDFITEDRRPELYGRLAERT